MPAGPSSPGIRSVCSGNSSGTHVAGRAGEAGQDSRPARRREREQKWKKTERALAAGRRGGGGEGGDTGGGGTAGGGGDRPSPELPVVSCCQALNPSTFPQTFRLPGARSPAACLPATEVRAPLPCLSLLWSQGHTSPLCTGEGTLRAGVSRITGRMCSSFGAPPLLPLSAGAMGWLPVAFQVKAR